MLTIGVDWNKAKIANIKPIFKKSKNNLGNYKLGWLACSQCLQDDRHVQAHARQESVWD